MGCCSCPGLILCALGAAALYFLYGYIKDLLLQRKLNRWKDIPKDAVIIHAFPPGKTLPNPSPFVIKVQTYLRMAKIPYTMDSKDIFGPSCKTPWMSINGGYVTDSEFIIEFLKKKFEKDVNPPNLTGEQLANANSLRIMLDEHFFWGCVLERFVHAPSSKVKKVMNDISTPIIKYASCLVGFRAKGQGIGLFPQNTIEQIMSKDLRIVSSVLGIKKFICGDEPCEFDAGIFGMLAQVLWGLPDSPYEKLVNSELVNLKEYCHRMKEMYWKDWDQIIRQ